MRTINNSAMLKFRGGDVVSWYKPEVKRDGRQSVRVVKEGQKMKYQETKKKEKEENENNW
jgi:hypothetical protein